MNQHHIIDFNDKSIRSLFFCNMQMMCITDIKVQKFLDVNHATEKALGYNRAEIILQDVENILLQKEHQKLIQLAENTGSASVHSKKEIFIIGKHGKLLHAEAAAMPVMFEGTQALLITMNDVTEKKLYRTMLEEAMEEESRLIIKNQQLKDMAYINLYMARRPLANILGLVNMLDDTMIADQTLLKTIRFLRESGNQLDELIKSIDPYQC